MWQSPSLRMVAVSLSALGLCSWSAGELCGLEKAAWPLWVSVSFSVGLRACLAYVLATHAHWLLSSLTHTLLELRHLELTLASPELL